MSYFKVEQERIEAMAKLRML